MGLGSATVASQQRFVVANVQLALSLPEQAFSFFLYFDMITRNPAGSPFPDFRSNLLKYFFIGQNDQNENTSIFSLSVDLIVYNLEELTVANQKVFKGVAKLVGYHSLLKEDKVSFESDALAIVHEAPAGDKEILNVPGRMYTTSQTSQFGYRQLLSAQFFLLKVV